MSIARRNKTWGLRPTEPAPPPRSEVARRSSRPEGTAPTPEEGLAAGDVVANRYLLTSPLGEGGMGAIWLARDLRLDIDVALKFIQRELASETTSERLLQEARAVARLDHRSIVRVFDFGESETGEPFMSMEVLRGELLTEVLDRKGRLAAPNAVCMLLPIASAVAAAHAKGIVHRDIKPDNILLVTDEATGSVVPKVLDFGIAQLRTRHKVKRITQNDAIVGTPDYMPPEQASGLGDVDPRADVWAFCVVLYQAITGHLPFEAETATLVLIAIVSAKPTPTTELAAGDEALWQIIEKGLQKDPDDRYQTMRELGQALARWVRDQGAETDVAGTSIAVHWLAERARRPLSDIPRAPDPTPNSGVSETDVPMPTGRETQASPTSQVEEGSRGRITWPPRSLQQQARVPSLEDLVRPVTLPPGLARTNKSGWLLGLVALALVGTVVGLYVQRDNPDVHAFLEKFGIVDPAPSAATTATATAVTAATSTTTTGAPPAATTPTATATAAPAVPTYRRPSPLHHNRGR